MTTVPINHRRLYWWQRVLALLMLVIILRLAYWQIWQHQALTSYAAKQYTAQSTLRARRGNIYDVNGTILVTNQELYTLFIEPARLASPAATLIEKLLPILAQSLTPTPQQATDSAWLAGEQDRIRQHLSQGLTPSDKKWVPLWSRVTRAQRQAILDERIPGLGFDPQLYRYYPEASMSAHVLGFLGKDTVGQDTGYFGVEGAYNLELRGSEGQVVRQRTALGLPLVLGRKQELPARAGRDLRLTIDSVLQQRVEAALRRGLERYGAQSGEIIIMDPHTGAIRALAAYPNYDPSNFIDFAPASYRNPSISDLYEPGSTFKVLTVAAGIEEGVITPETTCDNCAGPRVIAGFPIRTWNGVYNPGITMRDALAKSDNTAMVFIQERLGQERWLAWLERFGLDGVSGIDLEGEADYDLKGRDWRPVDLATAAFGQGIGVTSINLLRAVASIANGGELIQPHVVAAVGEDGRWVDTAPQPPQRVLSPQTARTVTEMMVHAASSGDAKWTAAANIKVAGKTGTAQIADQGQYLEDKTLTSFIGFAPADQPTYIMLVKLREPTSSPWGSETAAPLWYEVARELW